MSAVADDDVVAELRDRLRRHPADRHPLQHATAQFHLGGVLLARGILDEAEAAFAQAAALFAVRGAQAEQAKALNGLGATLRALGRPALAVRAFGHAAAGLLAAGLPLDEGAARCNLGVALREDGRSQEADEALGRAVELLDPSAVPAQAATAAREHGVTLLGLGRADAAEEVLRDAVTWADQARDEAGRGAAANALGLAQLALGRPGDAADAFVVAVAASPRAIRAEAFAMAKANLAVARERSGARAHARLAAGQALAVPAAPPPVRAQAAGVLQRLGTASSDLGAVLADERTDEARARVVREELLRGADLSQERLAVDVQAWLQAHTASALEPVEVAALWLGGLLELPPPALERMVRVAVRGSMSLPPEDRETFRMAVTRGMARFHVPQMMRLEEVFSTAAAEAGDPSAWR